MSSSSACAQMQSSKFISNFQVHVGAATNYSVVPWGGVAFNAHDAMQFSREGAVNNIADV